MTTTSSDTTASASDSFSVEQLRAHPMLTEIPVTELEWLLEHGKVMRFKKGEYVVKRGEYVSGLYVVMKGRVSHYFHREGVWQKVISWGEGEITGFLPYSRMGTANGNSLVDEDIEGLEIPRAQVADVPTACPQLTARLVHVMLDRAREFKTSDLQVEKLASLGRLAAGMAHELNNPASAAARSAGLLKQALADSEEASRAVGAAQLSEAEREALELVKARCLSSPASSVLSPLELADREDAIASWLVDRGLDESCASTLAETEVEIDQLAELASVMTGSKLETVLRWMASACTVHSLAHDIEHAATRVHDLVSAVKGFTYMDHGSAPEPVNVGNGLRDTLAVLGGKARSKSAAVHVNVAEDVPLVVGFGGELNQVWANLIDNALDAAGDDGRVSVSASFDGRFVNVSVVDNGPGIPPDVQSRMFDPFFTTKPVGAGAGLGLDIAQRLVKHHEGHITVQSEPGNTEFRVSLPLKAKDSG